MKRKGVPLWLVSLVLIIGSMAVGFSDFVVELIPIDVFRVLFIYPASLLGCFIFVVISLVPIFAVLIGIEKALRFPKKL